ncbi:MAG TPA: hypothetical protein DCW53_01330 [Rikenellaceae bacterium]|nr:hypothetical protein [Rikenellaceae bacterium]
MKKFIVVAFATLALAGAAMAQPRALGVRATWGAEVSYQHSVNSNFVEADLGLFGNGFYLTGVYDFIFASADGFNFYAGPGAQLGFYNGVNDEGNNVLKMGAGIVGQVGAEYNFPSIPLGLSLDWRPGFSFTGAGFGWQGFALGIRYRF